MTETEQNKLIKGVRNKTTDDVSLLPDDKILEFAAEDGDNWYADGLDLFGVIADSWEYLDRDDRYNSQQAGNLAASGPRAGIKAAYYRGRSRNPGGGGTVSQSTLRRTDVTSSASAGEFGG